MNYKILVITMISLFLTVMVFNLDFNEKKYNDIPENKTQENTTINENMEYVKISNTNQCELIKMTKYNETHCKK